MRLSQVRTESSPTGTSGRTSSIRGSHPSSLFRIFRVIPRTTRHSRPLGPRCSRTYSQRVRISSVLLARRPGIPEYGQAFTTPWTMWLVVTLGTRWPQSSSCGQVATVHSESMEAFLGRGLYTPGSGGRNRLPDSSCERLYELVTRPTILLYGMGCRRSGIGSDWKYLHIPACA